MYSVSSSSYALYQVPPRTTPLPRLSRPEETKESVQTPGEVKNLTGVTSPSKKDEDLSVSLLKEFTKATSLNLRSYHDPYNNNDIFNLALENIKKSKDYFIAVVKLNDNQIKVLDGCCCARDYLVHQKDSPDFLDPSTKLKIITGRIYQYSCKTKTLNSLCTIDQLKTIQGNIYKDILYVHDEYTVLTPSNRAELANSQARLGVYYQIGGYGPILQDQAEAIRWYKKAIKTNNHYFACMRLSQLFKTSKIGKNYSKKALKLMERARLSGENTLKQKVGQLNHYQSIISNENTANPLLDRARAEVIKKIELLRDEEISQIKDHLISIYKELAITYFRLETELNKTKASDCLEMIKRLQFELPNSII